MVAKVLQLVTIGTTPPQIVRDLQDPLLQPLGITAHLSKLQLAEPKYAFNKDRNQYHSNAIMRRLLPVLEPGSSFALGVLDVDLFVPDAPFVLGDADRESRTALLSIARLRSGADAALLRRRVQVEAAHQAAHLIGLSYCEDARCLMFLATTVQEVDRKGLGLCTLCRNEFIKISKQ